MSIRFPGIFMLAFGIIAFYSTVSSQVISTRAGVVKKVQGDVFYRCHENQKDALKLINNLKLHNEDTIVTAESSSAVLALNPDSFMYVDGDAFLKIKQTKLDKMHFDIERGEIVLFISSLNNGASLVIHTPPGILTIYKGGQYRVSVGKDGETEANVFGGELRYFNENGELKKLKKGRQVNFVKNKELKQ